MLFLDRLDVAAGQTGLPSDDVGRVEGFGDQKMMTDLLKVLVSGGMLHLLAAEEAMTFHI
jgi:hypothetical protein